MSTNNAGVWQAGGARLHAVAETPRRAAAGQHTTCSTHHAALLYDSALTRGPDSDCSDKLVKACARRAQEHNGARPPLQQRLYVAAVITVPALLGCLLLYALLHHRPDPYWEETLGKHRGGVGFRTGFRDPAATAALRLLFVGNSFVHRNEGAETVRALAELTVATCPVTLHQAPGDVGFMAGFAVRP